MTVTKTATPLAAPFQVSVTIFNSAGEKVKVVFDGAAAGVSNQITVSPGNGSAGGPTSIIIGGIQLASGGALTWDGNNDNGQWVTDGVYYMQVATTDSFGNIQTTTQAIPVVGAARTASLQIYNSAGEMVRNLPISNLNSVPTDFSVGSNTFVTGTDSSGQAQAGLQINLKMNNASSPAPALNWDGLSDTGQPVSSGTYIVKLSYTQAGQASVVKTISVTLLQGPGSPAKDAVASAVIAPNPFKPGGGKQMQLFYKVPTVGAGFLRIYNLDGELVAQSGDADRTGKLNITGDFSGGVYLMEFEIRNGSAVLAERVLKAAVIR
jgi:flagellar hook assembly protein FlgD